MSGSTQQRAEQPTTRVLSRGQALPLAMAWFACAIGCFVLAFEVGRVLNAKQRLVAAADAAAFSAAAFAARALNFESYVNRAVVANEVAIAHVLTLSSWLDYVDRTSSRVDAVARFVPYVAQVSAVLRRIAESANAAVQPALAPMPGFISTSSGLLRQSAETLHASVAVIVPMLVRENLADNDPNASLTVLGRARLAQHVRDWHAFTHSYAGPQRGRQASVVLASRDGFLAQRGHSFSGAGVVRVEKRGGTDLVTFDAWRAIDTLAAHVPTPFGGEEIALGWGGSHAGARVFVQGSHGGSSAVNPRTSRRASGDARRSSGYSGLPAIRDVRNRGAGHPPELWLSLEIERTGRFVPSAIRDLGADLLTRGAAPMAGESLVARSSARVFHERNSPRIDARREFGNLYSPHWHARLASAERVLP